MSKNNQKNMTTKRITVNAVMVALYFALSMIAILVFLNQSFGVNGSE